MDKATLIVDEPGARLSLAHRDVVLLQRPTGATHRIGVKGLKKIVLSGDITLTSKLLEHCLAMGVSFVLLPGPRGGQASHLFPQPAGALRTRTAQYAAYLDANRRMDLARSFVSAKIEAQTQCLRSRGVRGDLERFISSTRRCTDTNALMGAEGAASARYYALWGTLLQPPWKFSGRNRRPPLDPVNALLSLGYTLAAHAVGRLAAQGGFENALGYLHSPAPGRPSLALDLLEPLRPWVDEWVLSLCCEGRLKIDDFTIERHSGCLLRKDGRSMFFSRWHTNAEHYFERLARDGLARLHASLGLQPSPDLDFPTVAQATPVRRVRKQL